MRLKNYLTKKTQEMKSRICSSLYFVEKKVLNPIIDNEKKIIRQEGVNKDLCRMDYDGGQITNNVEVKIVDGVLCDNWFSEFVVKSKSRIRKMRTSLA